VNKLKKVHSYWRISLILMLKKIHFVSASLQQLSHQIKQQTKLRHCRYNFKCQLKNRRPISSQNCNNTQACLGYTGSWIFFNKKLILDYYFCLKSGPVFLFQIFIIDFLFKINLIYKTTDIC
jgi:hypothetical protein